METDNALKIIILGEAGVGKTNLINVAMGRKFEKYCMSTLLSSSNLKEFTYKNKKYIYNLWDTAGQESYRAVNKLFIKDSKIILIVFAIDFKKSFEQIDYWVKITKEILGEEGAYIMALVGNKIDLFEKQQITEKEIEEKANQYNMKYIITSACTQAPTFIKFVEELILDYITIEKGGKASSNIRLNDKKKQTNNNCNC